MKLEHLFCFAASLLLVVQADYVALDAQNDQLPDIAMIVPAAGPSQISDTIMDSICYKITPSPYVDKFIMFKV